jgi:hypothetical protein
MVRNGQKLGLSIDYLTDSSRPDGKGGRLLAAIRIVGGAVTPHPMNPGAFITEGKAASSAIVATVGQDIADGAARAERQDPARLAEDRLLASASWPPPGLFDRKTSLALVRGAAAAEAARRPADDGDRLARERYEQDNAYSSGLARWMAAHR